jgi:hypothetical protein
MTPGKHPARGVPEQSASAGGDDRAPNRPDPNRPEQTQGARGAGEPFGGWSDLGEELMQQARGVVGGQGLNGEPF